MGDIEESETVLTLGGLLNNSCHFEIICAFFCRIAWDEAGRNCFEGDVAGDWLETFEQTLELEQILDWFNVSKPLNGREVLKGVIGDLVAKGISGFDIQG